MKPKIATGVILFTMIFSALGFAQFQRTAVSDKLIKLIGSGKVKTISILMSGDKVYVSSKTKFQLTSVSILEFIDDPSIDDPSPETNEWVVDLSQVISYIFTKETGHLNIYLPF